MLDCLNEFLLGCLKGFLQFIGPEEFCFGAKQRLKWSHDVSELTIVRYLIDQPKPCSHVFDILRSREFLNRIEVFRKRLDLSFSYPKPSKVYFSLAELEFLWVEGDPRTT